MLERVGRKRRGEEGGGTKQRGGSLFQVKSIVSKLIILQILHLT
jgi:hypothetical protein